MSPECVCEVLAQNTPHIIYHIILKKPILSGSRNALIFVPVSLNPNELLTPPPFQNRAAPFQLVPDKKHLFVIFWMLCCVMCEKNKIKKLLITKNKNICFGSDYHVYRAEIMRFKPY